MKYIPLALMLVVFCTPAFCLNETAPAGSAPNSLQEQYKNLKTDLEIIAGYRMIKMYTIDKFWAIVEDSLLGQKSKIKESTALIAKQKEEVIVLNASLNKIKAEKQELKAGVDSLIVFGKPYSKAGFITVVSLVMLGLVVGAGILFSISKVAAHTARELRKLNESLYQEFDTYKRHAVEKEIKLSRELQNHRNKLAELKMT